ncbi:MAG TPA: dockerin type I domain-containing protein [Candidatus Udaeobacter sp.]|jgi:hypothetical protein|nr:dockerin type I domain-containing protein [Candidatus Udaeobacter sp.]
MKKRFTAKSAFFNPRILLSFFLCLGGGLLLLVAFTMYSGPSAFAQKPKQSAKLSAKPEILRLIGPVSLDMDLRRLPNIPQEGEEEEEEEMRTRYPFPRRGLPATNDPIQAVRQAIASAINMPAPIATYPGITSAQSGCGCLPPDTNGDVGPNHYIQTVNSRFKITNKTGTELLAPTTYNSLFSAMGPTTPCGANQNRGDPIAFYDHLADRWVLSDFAFPAFPGASFYQCVGVSKTSDPVSGGWWLYAIQVDPSNPTYLGDYPKFGLWPDAYYFSVNMFLNNTTFTGVRVFALPRNAMINGTGAPNAGGIAFSIAPATLGDTYSLNPATFRTGDMPAVGTPEYFLAINSSAVAGTVENKVFVWRFHVDFATPANSTFGVGANHAADGSITVNNFVDAFQSTTSAIVPQNGTTVTLDTLGDKIMYPVVYHKRNGIESLWADHTINNNQNGTGPTAIRWYQFNVTGGVIPATPAQQQTWNNAGDGFWRWMPSIAVDAQGNMAIAYSTSSSTTEPSIRYAGRLATDPANSLAQGEATMTAGGGHQTSSSGRWGDYSALGIDPADGMTFWHTNEYYSATGVGAWNTRIGNFRFPGAPAVVSAVSRKTHGGAGNFDINLPSTGNLGVEDRVGAVNGAHQIIVSFANNVSVVSAAVTSGTGNADNFSVNGGQVTVNLSGVTNAQVITVKLTGVNDGTNMGDVTVRMGVLSGDTTGDGVVNSSDVTQTKIQSGQATTASNFRQDVNSNGVVNSSDVSLVKSRSGTGLP